jgi:ribosome-associated protein
MVQGREMNNRQDMVNNESDQLLKIVMTALEDMKGVDIRVIDVRDQTSITDRMVIVSGTSTRHVKALAENVVLESKKNGYKPLGVEGETVAEWVLVDLADVVVHVMMPEIRDFYALEKLWSVGGRSDASA